MIIAVDPSMQCTGYAVLREEGEDGALVEAGTIQPPARIRSSMLDRLRYLVDEVQQIITEQRPTLYVVETPQTFTVGKSRRRSPATLPSYGCAVGALLVGVRLPLSCVTYAPSATEWTVGVPETKRDPLKSQRVFLVQHIYGLERDSLGVKSVAGNVADAILLARWALFVRRAAQQAEREVKA